MFSGWGKAEIGRLEISEIIEYLNHFRRIEAEKFSSILKGFAAYCLESTRLAICGTKSDCEKYLRRLAEKKSDGVDENDIDTQFKGANFGE